MDQDQKDITTSASIIQLGVLLNLLTSLLYINIQKNNLEFLKQLLSLIGSSYKSLTEEDKKRLNEMVEKTTTNQMEQFLADLKKSVKEDEFIKITTGIEKILNTNKYE